MTGVQAVLLPVGSDLYAVPMGWVREVVVAPPATRLVTAPPLVLGLFNLRGQVVPLLDTAALLGLPCASSATFAVVLQHQDGLIGLAATDFPQRALLGPSIGPSELPGTAGTYQWQGKVAVMLEPGMLLAFELLGRSGVRDSAASNGVGG